MHTSLLLATSLAEVLRPANHFAYRNTANAPPYPTTTIISTIDANVLLQEPQCRVLSSALAECQIRTPGFDSMEPTEQAECLCYNGFNVWVPSVFDDAAKTCVAHASMAAPRNVYDQLRQVESFCVEAGNVQMPTTPAPTSTSSGLSWCSSLHEYMKICSRTTPGFMNLEKTVQASCLCYATVDTTTFWLPHQFDDAVGSCGYAAFIAKKTEIYEAITSLNTLCASIGDGLNLPSLLAGTEISALTSHVSSSLPNSTGMMFISTTDVAMDSSIADQISPLATFPSKSSPFRPPPISPAISSVMQSSSSSTLVSYPVPMVPLPKATVPPIPGLGESEGRSMDMKKVIVISAVCAFLVLFL